MIDPVTEACRRVRDEIVLRSGGFEGYFDQLEELDRQRLAANRKTHKQSKPSPKMRLPKRTA